MSTRRKRGRARNGTGSVGRIRKGDDSAWGVRVTVEDNGVRKQKRLPGVWSTRAEAETALLIHLGNFNARTDPDEPLVASGVAGPQVVPPPTTAGRVLPPTTPTGEVVWSEALEALKYNAGPDVPLKYVYALSLGKASFSTLPSDRAVFYRGAIAGGARRYGQPITGRTLLGDLPVGDIKHAVLEDWATSLREPVEYGGAGLSASYVLKWCRHLHQTFQYAVRHGFVAGNPVQTRYLVPRGQVTRERPIPFFADVVDMHTLRQYAHPDDRLLVDLVCWSGMRNGEIRALTPGAIVRGPNPRLKVHATVHDLRTPVPGPPKTRGSRREIELPEPLFERLHRHVRANRIPEDKPLFPARNGGWMRGSWLTKRFRMLAEAADIKSAPVPGDEAVHRERPTPHSMRATSASLLLAGGVPVPKVQSWTGHATPQMLLGVYAQAERIEDPLIARIKGEGLSLRDTLTRLYVDSEREYLDFIQSPEHSPAFDPTCPDEWFVSF